MFNKQQKRAKRQLPRVIPPKSVFKLVRSDFRTPEWKKDLGRVFRIGYYREQDGLDCLWLVNERGEYEQTTDRDYLLKYFEPLRISREKDLYGTRRAPLRAIKRKPRRLNRAGRIS